MTEEENNKVQEEPTAKLLSYENILHKENWSIEYEAYAFLRYEKISPKDLIDEIELYLKEYNELEEIYNFGNSLVVKFLNKEIFQFTVEKFNSN